MCRGNRRHDIFRDDEDRLVYLTVLREQVYHLNPLGASIVDYPMDYPWSSYAVYLGVRGVVPPFQLEYEFFSLEEMINRAKEAAEDEEARAQLASIGMVRMVMLVTIFHPEINIFRRNYGPAQ